MSNILSVIFSQEATVKMPVVLRESKFWRNFAGVSPRQFCLTIMIMQQQITTTTWYYINYRRYVDSERIRVPNGIWTHDPSWSSRMLYHWAIGDSVVSKGQIVGIDWNRIARRHSHVLAHMNSLTASRCHIKASHMNSLRASRRHIKAYRDAANQPPKWVC